jgi:membrane-bound serine protease (ClpP class)
LFIAAGTILAMIPYIPKVTPLPDFEGFGLGDRLQPALLQFLLMVIVSGVGVWLLSKFLPKTSAYRRLVLEAELTRETGYTAASEKHKELLSRVGIAATALRPAGVAMFGDQRIDVFSSGDMIEKGTAVRVIQVQGSRIMVERAPEEQAPGAE